MWKKEKMLVTSIFSFYRKVFKTPTSSKLSNHVTRLNRIRPSSLYLTLYPFPKRQILDSSKLKVFVDDNFKLDGNGRKFSKRVENTVGKEKLLVTSNFSFSHSVFRRLELQTRKSQGLFGKGFSNNHEIF